MDKPNSAIDFSAVIATAGRRSEEEALFARDVDGRLIRVQKATDEDFFADVHLKINGRDVTVKRAVPMLDSLGAVIRKPDGRPVPRYTTIYDAAGLAFVRQASDQHPIATLCHREHLPPVGVCRVCLVEAAEMTKRGARKQLVPACVQRVSEGMEVHTFDSQADPVAAQRVKAAASVVTELLLADHAPGSNTPANRVEDNELLQVAARLGVDRTRFARGEQLGKIDNSSFMIAVNRDECIMCGRCIRGCNWVKENRIIGRAGKGYETHISFDLDEPMAESDCVSCGECAVSCPTGALTFTQSFLNGQTALVEKELREQGREGEIVPPQELAKIDLFSNIAHKFLDLNASSVVRRRLKAGDVLCREGEYGATAFLIQRGSFEIHLNSQIGVQLHTRSAKGFWGWLGSLTTGAMKSEARRTPRLTDLRGAEIGPNEPLVRTAEDVILGEMSCLNRSRRSATIVAREDSEVLEIRRNVLDMLLRNRVSREILDEVYRSRSINQLASLPIFGDLDAEERQKAADWLKDRVQLVRVEPGQTIFQQGEPADDFYMVSLGFVKVSQKLGEFERVVSYLGPGNHFGEIGLLSQIKGLIDVGDEGTRGTRTATCAALDHVELFQVRGADFKALLEQYPQIRGKFIENAKKILQRDREARAKLTQDIDEDFVNQGLFGAHNLLVLDLERCTRCDECTKACADTHEGVTRLIRDGMRFDRFLIASSCRSCMDPYCMVGCPVDAIHRNGDSLQIEIEDYCIGCGLCAENCPYGNINMHGFPKMELDPKTQRQRAVTQKIDGRQLPVIQQRATTCDMCMEIDGRPSCVYACPHNAAFRVTSEELQKML
ncbi:MAG: cyclic nucleotide-binding domain-containing protein [Aureliella sp.]